MLDWSLRVPERDAPLRIDHYFPYQAEWYSDEVANVREAVWMKSAQVGMTAYAWRWAARRADQFGDRAIYFFPTDTHVREFSVTRVGPSIRGSEYLSRRIPRHFIDQQGLKQIGSGDLALRGTQSEAAVQSVDADAIVFDEYDLQDQSNLQQAERRISGAKQAGREPRLRRLGYPTLPGFGIAGRYDASDQRVWKVTCPECGLEQQVLWENVRWRDRSDSLVHREGHDDYDVKDEVEEAWRACKECDASLEGEPLRTGFWEPQRPGARIVGYHVSRLIVPLADLESMVVASRATSETQVELFYMLDLGLPYVSSDSALTDEDIDGAAVDGLVDPPSVYRGRNVVTAGLDAASERDLNIRISEHLPDGRRRALYLGEPIDYKEVAELMERFNVQLLAGDAQPERRQLRALAATFPGRVALVRYDMDNPHADPLKYDPKKNMATVHRTEAIDAMMDSIRQRTNIPLRVPPRNYKAQLKSLKRRTVLDKKERPVRVYVKTGTEGDDYAHAEVYDIVASQLWVLKRQVEQAAAGAAGEIIADERLGFRRARLEDTGVDDYYPGLEEQSRY